MNHSSLYGAIKRIGFKKAFHQIGLDYRDYRHTLWNQEDMLDELRKIIEGGNWKGTYHLKKGYSRLYNTVYREFGFPKAFRKIGLDYENYKYR